MINLIAYSEDGGPLTDNVVLNSVQRALDLKRAAVIRDAIPGTNMARFFSIIYY